MLGNERGTANAGERARHALLLLYVRKGATGEIKWEIL